MNKKTTVSLTLYISKVCNMLTLWTCILILMPALIISQSETDKLSQCTWPDSVQSILNRNETIVLKIKFGREYKEWRNYSTLAGVLEDVRNGSLIVSYKNKKNIRIPINSIETIQVINPNAKKKFDLLVIGIILGLVGTILTVVGLFQVLGRLDSPSTGKKVYLAWLGPLISFLGLGLGIGGIERYNEFDKVGREITLIDPKCKCEWFERP